MSVLPLSSKTWPVVRSVCRAEYHALVPSQPQFQPFGHAVAQQHFGQVVYVGSDAARCAVGIRIAAFNLEPPPADGGAAFRKIRPIALQRRLFLFLSVLLFFVLFRLPPSRATSKSGQEAAPGPLSLLGQKRALGSPLPPGEG